MDIERIRTLVFAATGLPADDTFIRSEVDALCSEPGNAYVLAMTFCQAKADCLRSVLPTGDPDLDTDLETVTTALAALDGARGRLRERIDQDGRQVALAAIRSFKSTHAKTEAIRHGRAAL